MIVIWHIIYSFSNLLTAGIPTSRDKFDNKIIRDTETGTQVLHEKIIFMNATKKLQVTWRSDLVWPRTTNINNNWNNVIVAFNHYVTVQLLFVIIIKLGLDHNEKSNFYVGNYLSD